MSSEEFYEMMMRKAHYEGHKPPEGKTWQDVWHAWAVGFVLGCQAKWDTEE